MRFSEDKHGGDPRAEYDFSVNISPLGMSGAVFDACVSATRVPNTIFPSTSAPSA